MPKPTEHKTVQARTVENLESGIRNETDKTTEHRCGGTKSTQKSDIAEAKARLKNWNLRR